MLLFFGIARFGVGMIDSCDSDAPPMYVGILFCSELHNRAHLVCLIILGQICSHPHETIKRHGQTRQESRLNNTILIERIKEYLFELFHDLLGRELGSDVLIGLGVVRSWIERKQNRNEILVGVVEYAILAKHMHMVEIIPC